MKKIMALLLALCMVLALCACRGAAGKDEPAEEPESVEEPVPTEAEPQLDRNSTATYLGTWEYESEYGNKRLIINRGGVGIYEGRNEKATIPEDKNFTYDFTYEVKDETLVISMGRSVGPYISSFELNEDGSALIHIQGSLIVAVPNGDEFTKK